MRIGILSDTHDRLPAISRALSRLQDHAVEALIHPGDIIAPFAAKPLLTPGLPLYVTYGNNDGERAGLKRILPQIQDGPLFVTLAGRTILIHHFIEWCSAADVARADVIITGHTHEVAIEQRHGKLFLNPGECCGWVTGRATAAVLDLPTLEVELIELSL